MTAGELWIQWGGDFPLRYRDANDIQRRVLYNATVNAPAGLFTVHVPGEIAIDYASKRMYWISSEIQNNQRMYGHALLTLTGNPAKSDGIYITGQQLCVGIDGLEYAAPYV